MNINTKTFFKHCFPCLSGWDLNFIVNTFEVWSNDLYMNIEIDLFMETLNEITADFNQVTTHHIILAMYCTIHWAWVDSLEDYWAERYLQNEWISDQEYEKIMSLVAGLRETNFNPTIDTITNTYKFNTVLDKSDPNGHFKNWVDTLRKEGKI